MTSSSCIHQERLQPRLDVGVSSDGSAEPVMPKSVATVIVSSMALARCSSSSAISSFPLLFSFDEQHSSGEETVASPKGNISIRFLMYFCLGTCYFKPLIPHRPPTGRRYNDHGTVLGGILWVARTGSSWREMPEEFGKWQTAYRRYELWMKHRLWQRILGALGEEGLQGPATKEH